MKNEIKIIIVIWGAMTVPNQEESGTKVYICMLHLSAVSTL